MSGYPVNSDLAGMRSTGKVFPAKAWVETADGRRRPSDVQAVDEASGLPVWEVEVLYEEQRYGEETTKTGRVTIPSPTQPILGKYEPISFTELWVSVYSPKGSSDIRESWSARGFADGRTGTEQSAERSSKRAA